MKLARRLAVVAVLLLPWSARAAVAWVATGSPNFGSAMSAINAAIPVGVLQKDDLILGFFASGNTSSHTCTTTGYREALQVNAGPAAHVSICWKRSAGIETGDVSVSQGGSSTMAAVVVIYRGATTIGAPFDWGAPISVTEDWASAFAISSSTANPASISSITTNSSGELLIAFGAFGYTTNATISTGLPTGLIATNRLDQGAGSGSSRLGMTLWEGAQVSYGATGTASVTVTPMPTLAAPFAIGMFGLIPQTAPAAEMPVATPPGDVYSVVPSTVALSCSSPSPVIRYTTDGSDPDPVGSPIYASPITVATSTTIKAICQSTGLQASPVATANYTLTSEAASLPVTYVGPSTPTAYYGAAGGTQFPVVPSGILKNDVLLLLAGTGDNSTVLIGDSGWTPYLEANIGSNTHASIFWKRVAANGAQVGDSIPVSYSGSAPNVTMILPYRNAKSYDSPFDTGSASSFTTTPPGASSLSGVLVSTPSITTHVPGAMVLFLGAWGYSNPNLTDPCDDAAALYCSYITARNLTATFANNRLRVTAAGSVPAAAHFGWIVYEGPMGQAGATGPVNFYLFPEMTTGYPIGTMQIALSPNPAPTISSFSSSPQMLPTGGGATALSWSTTVADARFPVTSVTIDHGVGAVAANGSATVRPRVSTVYTLTATNAFGSATRQLQVGVLPAEKRIYPTVNGGRTWYMPNGVLPNRLPGFMVTWQPIATVQPAAPSVYSNYGDLAACLDPATGQPPTDSCFDLWQRTGTCGNPPAEFRGVNGCDYDGQVRMFVASPQGNAWWRNVEMTAYYRWQDFVGASGLQPHWSMHLRGDMHGLNDEKKRTINNVIGSLSILAGEDGVPPPPGTVPWPWWNSFGPDDLINGHGLGTAYHGLVYAQNRSSRQDLIEFEKEGSHTQGYAATISGGADPRGAVAMAGNPTGGVFPLPFNRWVGMKFVLRNNLALTQVKMELWIDANVDGNWVKISEYVDQNGIGNDWVSYNGLDGLDLPPYSMPLNGLITWAGPYADFRADSMAVDFGPGMSIREVQPFDASPQPVPRTRSGFLSQ